MKFAKKKVPKNSYLKFALEVEKETTAKKNNLILNVDGCIAAVFLDIMDSCKDFTKDEQDEIVEQGYLNGLFILGRSIGILGHVYDQKRLKAGLYRHPYEDILYMD